MNKKACAIAAACAVVGLLVFLGEGVFTQGSTGRGTSAWVQQLKLPDSSMSFESISAADQNNVWAVGGGSLGEPVWGTGYGIWHTTDGGATWSEQTGPGWVLVDVCAVNSSTAWAVAGETDFSIGSPGAVMKTADGGVTWNVQWQDDALNFYGVSAVDANTAWVVGNSIWKTSDGGATWVPQGPTDLARYTIKSVCAADANVAWAVGQDYAGGPPGNVVFKTTNGGTNWTSLVPETDNRLDTIASSDADHAWAGGEWTTILGTDDGGSTWLSQTHGYGYTWDIFALDATTLWAAAGSQWPILKSNDGGLNWMSQDVDTMVGAAESITAVSDQVAWACNWDTILHTTIGGGYDYNWYFAEGCTREGFREWLSIQNANPGEIQVHAQYMLFGGAPLERTYTIPANSRLSVNVNTEVGDGQDVAVRLMGTDEFFAERPLYCDYKPDVPGYAWSGGHDTMGARAPRTDWYFAEGCTRAGFEEWIAVQNPNNNQATVKVDYISAGAPTVRKEYTAEANSRISVFVNGDMGPGQDVSAHVFTEGAPIVAERVMYFDYQATKNPGVWDDGHVVMGVDSPRMEWYFAEGCTRAGFEEWLCVQNPNPAAADLTLTYNITGEAPVQKTYSVPANSRGTLDVNAEVGPDKDVSVHIISSEPVIMERPLYFDYTGRGAPGWNGGSAEMGVTSPATDWYFAEGYTGEGFHEWICIQNTGTSTADVTVTYNIEGAAPVVKNHTVPPGRYTIFVNDDAGQNLNVSAQVHSSAPVICERSMYFDYTGWNGGHCAKGYAP